MDYEAEAGVEAFAVAYGELEGAIIGGEDDDVAGGVKHSGADLAGGKMALHIGAHRWIERVIDVIGDVVPHMAAV